MSTEVCSGPELWNIVYDDLLQQEIPNNCEIIGFCDNTLALISGNDTKIIEEKANILLKVCQEWDIRVKLEFNPIKSTSVLISNKRNYYLPQIYLNSTQIKIEDNIKYLGLTIDKKLNFNKHINNIYNKCVSKIIKLPFFARNVWGLKSDSIKSIYTAVIEPLVLYCSSIWAQK